MTRILCVLMLALVGAFQLRTESPRSAYKELLLLLESGLSETTESALGGTTRPTKPPITPPTQLPLPTTTTTQPTEETSSIAPVTTTTSNKPNPIWDPSKLVIMGCTLGFLSFAAIMVAWAGIGTVKPRAPRVDEAADETP